MKLLHSAIVVCIAVWGMICRAEPVLPTLFSDHMVLQQDREIHVWGRADPAEKVAVSIAGHRASAVADPTGRWSVHLPALGAGGPFTLMVQGTKQQVLFKDVMVGEVWVASGQSNMTFALSAADGANTELPKADYAQIRLFTVPKKIARAPQENTLPTGWQICTPDTAKSFSAVAYFFARDLHKNLNVPIGVIQSAWPGTSIEEWMDPDVLRSDPELRPIFDQPDHGTARDEKFADQLLPFELELDDFELIPSSSAGDGNMLANFDDGTTRTSMGGTFSYGWADAPDTTFDLVSPGRRGGFAARVAGRLDGAQTSLLTVRYRPDRSPVDLNSYAGIRFWVRGNGSFRFRSLQPTITDYDDYSTPVLKATADWQAVTIWFRDLRQEGWGVDKPFTQDALWGFSIESLTTLGYVPMPVSGLYQGMITPLLPYAFRGAIWYQGESNALRAYQYRKLLPTLIANWRKASRNENLEFLIVQLPNHGATPNEPGESAWAELREAQLLTVEHTPRTGLAVTIDVGDAKDLHPHRKAEVGQRLALWALGTTYRKPIVYAGPLYESMDIAGSEIRIHFSHVGAGLEAHGAGRLEGLSIAGVDRKFHWADARIEGDTVVVSSRDVANPVAVRYAWADSPVCNLFNKDGLPASPFRTDDWPGITRQTLTVEPK